MREYIYLYPQWPHRRFSGIPKVTCSISECIKSCDLCLAFLPCNKWSSAGTALCKVGGNGQLIGFTVSYAIVRSWLWSTATGSSPLGTSVALLQVIDN